VENEDKQEDIVECSDRTEDWPGNILDVKINLQYQQYDASKERVLCMIVEMCRLIEAEALALNSVLDGLSGAGNLGEPIQIDPRAKDHLPSSRPSHGSSTPKNKNMLKTPKHNPISGSSAGRGRKKVAALFAAQHGVTFPADVADIATIQDGALIDNLFDDIRPDVSICDSGTYREVLNVAVIAKRYSEESFYLQTMQGSANVVRLFESFNDQQIGLTVLLEELLQPFHIFWEHRGDSGDFFGHGCGYILDGLDALQQLRDKRIIHRDISPRNILYSPIDNMWKLVDFESACFADSVDECDSRGKNYGTKDFIAPELEESGAPYSFDTDCYSFGCCAVEMFGEPMIRATMLNSEDPTLALATEVLSICDDLAASNTSNRLTITAAGARMYRIVVQAFDFGLSENIPSRHVACAFGSIFNSITAARKIDMKPVLKMNSFPDKELKKMIKETNYGINATAIV
jgi:hypothetical protein